MSARLLKAGPSGSALERRTETRGGEWGRDQARSEAAQMDKCKQGARPQDPREERPGVCVVGVNRTAGGTEGCMWEGEGPYRKNRVCSGDTECLGKVDGL